MAEKALPTSTGSEEGESNSTPSVSRINAGLWDSLVTTAITAEVSMTTEAAIAVQMYHRPLEGAAPHTTTSRKSLVFNKKRSAHSSPSRFRDRAALPAPQKLDRRARRHSSGVSQARARTR